MDTGGENTVKELNEGAALVTASNSVPTETVVFPEPLISLIPLGLDDSASTREEIDQVCNIALVQSLTLTFHRQVRSTPSLPSQAPASLLYTIYLMLTSLKP